MNLWTINKLRDKFLLIIISLILFVFSIFSYTLYQFEKRQIIQSTQFNAESLLRNTSYAFTIALKSNDQVIELQKAASLLQRDKNIVNLIIKNKLGNTIYALNQLPKVQNNKSQTPHSKIHKNIFYYNFPLFHNKEMIGSLILDYSQDAALSKIQYFKYFIIIAAFGAIVIAFFLAIALARMVTKQIELLTIGVQKVSFGNYSHKVKIITNDELGNLAKSFNNLFSNLKESYKESYQKRQELLEEKNKLRTILANLNQGVILIDKDQKIYEINQAAENVFDIYSKIAIGQNINQISPNQEYLDFINDFTKEDQPFATKTIEFDKSIIYKVSLVRAINEANEVIGIISVFTDITKEHELTQSKTNLLHIMSHELKTPLATIIGFLGLLEKEGKDYINIDHIDYIRTAKQGAENLKLLVNNLLDLSRLEANKMEIHYSEFELPALADSVIKFYHLLLEEKKLKIVTNYQPNNLIIDSDKNKIRQIISNIMDNAIKFTSDGTITVSITQVNGNAILTIQDSGIGISKNKLSDIFGKFNQVDSSITRKHDGAGLGLSIVKEFTKLLEGTIEVTSTVNQGTTFKISFPTKRSQSQI